MTSIDGIRVSRQVLSPEKVRGIVVVWEMEGVWQVPADTLGPLHMRRPIHRPGVRGGRTGRGGGGGGGGG